MVYTSNTPNSSDKINLTQPLIKANFQDLDTFLAVDHQDLNELGAGNHKFVHLLDHTGSEPTVAAGECAIWSQTVNSRVNPYCKMQSGGSFSNISIPMLPIKAFGVMDAAGAFTNSFNFTGGTLTSAGKFTITMTNAMPSTSYMVFATCVKGSSNLYTNIDYEIVSTTQFKITTLVNGSTFQTVAPYNLMVLSL